MDNDGLRRYSDFILSLAISLVTLRSTKALWKPIQAIQAHRRSNSIRNLWPQSTKTSPWNSYVKDALESKLHKLVCADQSDLKTAKAR
jgi:hypothetical protein